MECIILAGGLGTRLRGVIGEQPKCMALLNTKPFLYYLFTYLQQQSCSRIILSLGYKHETILQWLSSNIWTFAVDYVVEEEPLGTGGGIRLAIKKANDENVIVLNGDTLMLSSLIKLLSFHKKSGAKTTVTLTKMEYFDRYGTVTINEENTITAFKEKSYQQEGIINAGVYAIHKDTFLTEVLPDKFSFEKDYLEKNVGNNKLNGYQTEGYFIDIGVPDDYQKAKTDFKTLFG